LLAGLFDDVLAEVEALMRATLKQEGFAWKMDNRLTRPFRYDREIMVQVLINLIENSVKFGKGSGAKVITVRQREVFPGRTSTRFSTTSTGRTTRWHGPPAARASGWRWSNDSSRCRAGRCRPPIMTGLGARSRSSLPSN
jgi:hypothetical protein